MPKLVLYLVGGGVAGAMLGYANQCAGGTCPLMCLWWRGAIFGALAGLLVYLAGVSSSTKRNAKNGAQRVGLTRNPETGKSVDAGMDADGASKGLLL
ncbi:MAG: DUF6132 family protein [Verrucomicrobia bacterium]|nr:DUF6132 family protein [Verrucomicrobiota bacterium]